MKRLVAVLLVLTYSLLAVDASDDVREAASGWRQAVLKRDTAALERLLADDLTYTHASGKTQTKAEYIASIPSSKYESFTESDTKIRVYGKAAVLTGFVDVKLAGAEPYRVRTIEMYVQNPGGWQMVAKQSARISK